VDLCFQKGVETLRFNCHQFSHDLEYMLLFQNSHLCGGGEGGGGLLLTHHISIPVYHCFQRICIQRFQNLTLTTRMRTPRTSPLPHPLSTQTATQPPPLPPPAAQQLLPSLVSAMVQSAPLRRRGNWSSPRSWWTHAWHPGRGRLCTRSSSWTISCKWWWSTLPLAFVDPFLFSASLVPWDASYLLLQLWPCTPLQHVLQAQSAKGRIWKATK